MGCRYAGGANSPEAFWKLLVERRDGYSAVPKDRFNWDAFHHPDSNVRGTTIQKGGHFLDQELGSFDAGFFGIPSVEAQHMDPQQRLLLEASWEAVESAGICMDQFKGSQTGVYVAMFGHDWEHMITKDPLMYTNYHSTGVSRTLLSNRVSYVFDLKGPSFTLDTGCSGSLVAVNSACQSLKYGETDMALAGGVGLIFSPEQLALMSQVGIFNKDGRCYSFDDRGSGYGRAEGIGIIALKRLSDAIRDGNDIRAIIRNSNVNQDGRTNGITLPSQAGQESNARKLFEKLDFSPRDVQYVEAHGTGTQAGDTAEMRAIHSVFGEGRDGNQPLLVGTCKPNIGHSESASGSAGLIKTVLAMEKGYIPPNILLENMKPSIAHTQDIIKVPQALEPWPSTATTRKAVVNSLGSGGTNAMVALESLEYYSDVTKLNGTNGELANGNYRAVNGVGGTSMVNGANGVNNTNRTDGVSKTDRDDESDGVNASLHINGDAKHPKPPPRLFVLSARSEFSLTHGLTDLREWLVRRRDDGSRVDLDDLSHTLAAHRSHFQWRCGLVAPDMETLIERLGTRKEILVPFKSSARRMNVFVFTGQGAQYFQMGSGLIGTEAEFTKSIRASDQTLRDLGASWSLVDELLKDESSSLLNDSTYGQPASTAIQLAIVDMLSSWAVTPSAVVGHSSGEIAAAYAAGVLTRKAEKQVRGAMMAVGMGEDEVRAAIQSLRPGDTHVVVACVNSPSSTTVSGDHLAVLQLQEALTEKGTFAPLLKVDTAYHSHHMQAASGDYASRLGGVRSGSLDEKSSVRFFSSVTGKEKLDGFGASYWVENLVSQVRFSRAVDALCREMGSRDPLNFIEIGPHKALSGPIRQSVAHLQKDASLSYRYIPTLVRGQDDVVSVADVGSSLYTSGVNINISAVASLGASKDSVQKRRLVKDLPHYHWDHTQTHWSESRLSRGNRLRKHPHHDLLGLRTLTSPGSDPSWRHIISTQTLPWLRDHKIESHIIFPGAGYVAMAIEAVRQLTRDQHPNMEIRGYSLKNVSFKRTLSVPDDANGVEVILNMRHSEARPGFFEFLISSNSDGEKWQQHCEGYISIEAQTDMDEVEQGRAAATQLDSYVSDVKAARSSCSQTVSRDELYTELTRTGNQYGPNFTLVEGARLAESNSESLSTVVLPDIAAVMPSGFMQPHVVHPTLFDALLHTCVLLFQRHEKSSSGSIVPVFFADTFVSASILNKPGDRLQALSKLHTTFANSSNFDLVAFHASDSSSGSANQSIKPMLTLMNGEVRVIGESQVSSDLTSDASDQNVFTVHRGLDMSSLTAADLASIVIPLQSDEVGITPQEKVALLYSGAAHYIDRAVRNIRQRGLKVQDDYRVNQFAWMSKYVDSEECGSLLNNSIHLEGTVRASLSRLGGEGEIITKIGENLTTILTGETDPIGILLEDNLLYRIYSSDATARANQYMAVYTKHLTFQQRGLRILEIGAGTGGATLPLLQQCSPNGQPFCAEYLFTDISAGYFENVLETKLKEWEQLITFQTLDLEADPISQGFDEHGYDLILASNVVHATKSLKTSLSNIHRLLRPGGVLGLVEAARLVPYFNMTFGSLPGWWAGFAEGRVDGPVQSIDEWNQHLIQASFSGVELAVDDFPEPGGQCAFIASKSLDTSTTNGNGHSDAVKEIKIIYASSEARDLGHEFGAGLQQGIESKGYEISTQEWFSDPGNEVGNKTSYVIVDSAAHPFLVHASSAQFDDLMSLLTKSVSVHWITLSSSPERSSESWTTPSHGIITGVARSAHTETDGLRMVTVNVQDDLQGGDADQKGKVIEVLSRLIVSSEDQVDKAPVSHEAEYILRDGKLYIDRIVAEEQLISTFSESKEEDTKLEECRFHQPGRPLRVQLAQPGLLSSMRFVDDENIKPDEDLHPDEVEVEVQAFGVNFKDLFVSLGQMKPTHTMVGEGAGIVSRVGSSFAAKYSVGQRVAVMAGTPYASRTRTNGHHIHPIPSSLTFSDAASIPVSYATAFYGLVDCANLSRGQTVLIHAASGGLGQAAIMIAQHIGATIFATVGSRAKAQLLVNKYGIPDSHIFSSRTADFKVNIMQLTGQQGVDVVLNSLSGDSLRASWECVAMMGTFVEVGKTDIFRRSQLDMEPFDRNVKFASVDLVVLAKHRPQIVQELLRRVFEHVEAGHYSPLPVTSMPVADIEQAFRLMQARKHTGKIVLEAGPEATVKATVPELRLHRNGIYVIAGGLGSIGRQLCRHFQDRGARHIALLSRRNFDAESRAKLEEGLAETSDAKVQIMTCDVVNPAEVMKVAELLATSSSPVRGVVQGTILLRDHTLTQMHLDDFQAGLEPKYFGTINLAKAFTSDALDFFVTLSSLAGIVGLPGQSNYVAANTFQDQFVESQVSHGNTQFFTINIPLIRETEMKAKETAALVVRNGVPVVSVEAVLSVVDYIIGGQARKDKNNHIVFGMSPKSLLDRVRNNLSIPPLLEHIYATSQQDSNFKSNDASEVRVEDSIAKASTKEEAEQLILAAVRDKVSALIVVDAQELSVDDPMAVLGLDSLVAIELKNWIIKTLQAPVQTTDIMDSPSLKAFASFVLQKSALVAK